MPWVFGIAHCLVPCGFTPGKKKFGWLLFVPPKLRVENLLHVVAYWKRARLDKLFNQLLLVLFANLLSTASHILPVQLASMSDSNSSHNCSQAGGLDWLDLAMDSDVRCSHIVCCSLLILFHVSGTFQSLSISLSFKTKFHFERAAVSHKQTPVLKLKTCVNLSDTLSGPEYKPWGGLIKEVFDEDLAVPYGENRFLWDSVDIAHKWTFKFLLYATVLLF